MLSTCDCKLRGSLTSLTHSRFVTEDPDSGANSHLLHTPGGTWKRAFEQAVKAAAAPPEVVADVEAQERARINGLVTESMRRLSQRSSKAQGTTGSEAEDGSVGSKAAEGVAAGLIDSQLETLRGQQMVSPAAAAARVLGTFTAAVSQAGGVADGSDASVSDCYTHATFWECPSGSCSNTNGGMCLAAGCTAQCLGIHSEIVSFLC